MEISGNLISGNMARDLGGGLLTYNTYTTRETAGLHIFDNEFSGNEAEVGGGLYGFALPMDNNVVTGNVAVLGGGGVAGYVYGEGNTITGNTPDDQSSLYGEHPTYQ